MNPNSEELLGQAREVHRGRGARVVQVEQEVAVGHGIERVGDHGREAHGGGGHPAVERIACTGERRGAERAGISRVEGGAQALEIAGEHPVVREQVMAQQHRLGMLEVRVAGQHRVGMRRRRVQQRATQLHVGLHKPLGERLRGKPGVRGDLVVAGAARVQALACLADPTRELALDRHVDVFIVDVEGEVPGIDVRLDGREPLLDPLGVLPADDALVGQHGRMRLGSGDVLLGQVPVDRQRRAELLGRGGDARLEPASPQCHGNLPQRTRGRRKPAGPSCGINVSTV